MADFHKALAQMLNNPKMDMSAVIGFRSSAKTTFCSLAYPLWAALTERHKFIVIINDTDSQVEMNIANIKYELENNVNISKEFGISVGEVWSKTNLLLTNGVRIIGRSRGQKIRGIRHRQFRPDLMIVDDPEDLRWVQKKENRDKTEKWFTAEVIPAQQEDNSKLIVIGNLLHNDALMARLKRNPIFKTYEFPLIDKNGEVTWKAKYPTQEALDKQKAKVGSTAWAREYLLKIVPEDEQIITDQDIKKYPAELLKEINRNGEPEIRPIDAGAGVDLAISLKQTADYTAIVSGIKAKWENRIRLFVKPFPTNKRMDFDATIKEVKNIRDILPYGATFYVEGVAYQKVAVEQLSKQGVTVKSMQPITDKRARLQSIAHYIKDGTVVFADKGCEILIDQLVNFGAEEHDDLCLDGETEVLCKRGKVKIKDVLAGDQVMTRKGWKKVLWSGQTGFSDVIENIGIKGTKNHPVITQKGVKGLQYINETDITYIWNEKLSCIEERNIIGTQNPSEDSTVFIIGNTINTKNHPKHCIGKFGKTILDALKIITLYITKTVTQITIKSKILNVFLGKNMQNYTQQNQNELKNQKEIYSKHKKVQKNGTDQKRALNGISNTQLIIGRIRELLSVFVKGVKKVFKPTIEIPECAVQLAGTTSTCRVKKQKVYNLLVEDEHEFFANGVLVHNCDALVYLILGLLRGGNMKVVDKIDQI